MALKDWTQIKHKKLEKSKGGHEEITWQNNKIKEQLNLYSRSHIGENTSMYGEIFAWGIAKSSEPYWSNTAPIKGDFKTKSQAIAFAKEYMRTH